jgi:hypothetical protein
MVPPPSVVVVVVVVLEVCPQANGATTASAMLSNVFFTDIPSLLDSLLRSPGDASSREKGQFAFHLIRMTPEHRFPIVAFF